MVGLEAAERCIWSSVGTKRGWVFFSRTVLTRPSNNSLSDDSVFSSTLEQSVDLQSVHLGCLCYYSLLLRGLGLLGVLEIGALLIESPQSYTCTAANYRWTRWVWAFLSGHALGCSLAGTEVWNTTAWPNCFRAIENNFYWCMSFTFQKLLLARGLFFENT